MIGRKTMVSVVAVDFSESILEPPPQKKKTPRKNIYIYIYTYVFISHKLTKSFKKNKAFAEKKHRPESFVTKSHVA